MGSSEGPLPRGTRPQHAGRVLVRGSFCWPAVGAALQKPELEARSGPCAPVWVRQARDRSSNTQGTQVPEQLTHADHQLFGAD